MLIAFKIKLALACMAGLAGPLAVAPLLMKPVRSRRACASSGVRRGAGRQRHLSRCRRLHAQANRRRPRCTARFETPLAIMKHQTSAADYQRCVEDGGCQPFDRGVVVAADRPVVQVSWHDAKAYAAWLSRKTGEKYRLPTDEEWAFAAGDKFRDDGLPVDEKIPQSARSRVISANPSACRRNCSPCFRKLWRQREGPADIGGNVWEWTNTCFIRSVLDGERVAMSQNSNCGVRVSCGTAPVLCDRLHQGCPRRRLRGWPAADNLGFRLVREPPKAWAGLVAPKPSEKRLNPCSR